MFRYTTKGCEPKEVIEMVRKNKDGEIVPRTEAIRPFSLMTDIDRMFEDMDSWFWGPSFALTPRMTNDGLRVPRVNVKDEGDRFVVTAELPGVSKEDLELEIHDNVLEINAEEKTDVKEEDEKSGFIYREMRRSSFHRQIPFGRDIRPEECEAELKDGILTVNLKKLEEDIPKRHSIAVK
jgi:HSP20 family protein